MHLYLPLSLSLYVVQLLLNKDTLESHGRLA